MYNENEVDKVGKPKYTPYEEGLHELYEHLFELENNKPIGVHPSWDKKYEYYKNKIKEYEV